MRYAAVPTPSEPDAELHLAEMRASIAGTEARDLMRIRRLRDFDGATLASLATIGLAIHHWLAPFIIGLTSFRPSGVCEVIGAHKLGEFRLDLRDTFS